MANYSDDDFVCCGVVLLAVGVAAYWITNTNFIDSEEWVAPEVYEQAAGIVKEQGFHCPAVACFRSIGVDNRGDRAYFVFCGEDANSPNRLWKYTITEEATYARKTVSPRTWDPYRDWFRTALCGPEEPEPATSDSPDGAPG